MQIRDSGHEIILPPLFGMLRIELLLRQLQHIPSQAIDRLIFILHLLAMVILDVFDGLVAFMLHSVDFDFKLIDHAGVLLFS